MSLIIGPRIDHSRVAIARERLAAWYDRRLPANLGGRPEWKDWSNGHDADDVCAILRSIDERASFGVLSAYDARLARAVFRRAIGHARADTLHRDNSGAVYAAWYFRD